MATGTILNRERQARAYLAFAVAYNVDYLRPSPLDAAMYAQFLANSHASPASIKNYLSGARTWITQHLGDPSALSSTTLFDVVKKLSKDSQHVPSPALPISEVELKVIIDYLCNSVSFPHAVIPCILLSFACMLRASNVTSHPSNPWRGAHTLRAADIIIDHHGLSVLIRSTKTTGGARPHLIRLYPAANPTLCPVRAWTRYVALLAPPRSGPAFILHDGKPLTTGPVVTGMRLALTEAGYDNVNRYSMHSLRRGAVQLAERLGADHRDIMSHGLWSSTSGLNYYTSPVSPAVARLLADGLA